MSIKNIINNSYFKSLAIFLGLAIITAILVINSYHADKKSVEKQAKDIVILQSEKMQIYLEGIIYKIKHWQKNLNTWESLDKKMYNDLAMRFIRLNPSVLAFNFVSKDYVISSVYRNSGVS